MVVPLIPALKRHWQEELSEFESSRPAWFTQRVPQQLGLYSRPCFKTKSQSTNPKCLKDISGTPTMTLSPKDTPACPRHPQLLALVTLHKPGSKMASHLSYGCLKSLERFSDLSRVSRSVRREKLDPRIPEPSTWLSSRHRSYRWGLELQHPPKEYQLQGYRQGSNSIFSFQLILGKTARLPPI